MTRSDPSKRASRSSRSAPTMVILPADPGRKSKHLAIITHRGGGWYDVVCMGEAKRCSDGACRHTSGMRWDDSARPIRQVPRDGVDSADKSGPRRANDRAHGKQEGTS
jgi:hypothetical protein